MVTYLEINPLNRPSLSISRCRSRYEADLSVSVDRFYFVTGTDIFNVLEFLIDNIFVMFGGRVFQQTAYEHKLCSSSRRLVPLFV
jgi:hypothetical protein